MNHSVWIQNPYFTPQFFDTNEEIRNNITTTFNNTWTRDGSVGVSPASAKNQQWAYDAAGNWTSTTKTIGNTTTTHDAKGNLTAYEINGKEYEVDYDLDNRIIKADIDGDDVEYRYDAFGRRVIRKEGSTKTALIWWANSEKHRRPVGVLDRSVATCPVGVKAREASLNQCSEYKHSSGQLDFVPLSLRQMVASPPRLQKRTRQGRYSVAIQNDLFAHPIRLNAVIARTVDGSISKLQWYHKNYLDHVYAVSDDDGNILEHYRYTAFGEVTIYNATDIQQTTTQINNQILWNTRRRDTVSGYYMYKFRHYSPELGRWLSRDPIEEKGGINLYAFLGNDGINLWDELGLKEEKFEIELEYTILEPDESVFGESPGARPVRSLQEIVDDIQKRIRLAERIIGRADCACIKKLVIWTHGSIGTLNFQDGEFDEHIKDKLKENKDLLELWKNEKGKKWINARNRLRESVSRIEQTIKRLQTLGIAMCKGSTVQFYACEAGKSKIP